METYKMTSIEYALYEAKISSLTVKELITEAEDLLSKRHSTIEHHDKIKIVLKECTSQLGIRKDKRR